MAALWYNVLQNTAAAAAAKSPSRVRLCVTPQTAAHQAPPSLGFSRQECYSGVPLPSPYRTLLNNKEDELQIHMTMWIHLQGIYVE